MESKDLPNSSSCARNHGIAANIPSPFYSLSCPRNQTMSRHDVHLLRPSSMTRGSRRCSGPQVTGTRALRRKATEGQVTRAPRARSICLIFRQIPFRLLLSWLYITRPLKPSLPTSAFQTLLPQRTSRLHLASSQLHSRHG